MSVKLLTEHHLEFLSLKEAAEAHLKLHMSKCHIVRNAHVNFKDFYVKASEYDQEMPKNHRSTNDTMRK